MAALFLHWRAILAALAALMLAGAVWIFADWRHQARKNDELRAALEQAVRLQKKTQSVGQNLETGLNDYRPKAREIDSEVNNAPHPDRFNAERLRWAKDRNAAGRAARQRAGALR